ncbi:MAG: hypothetical protein WA081_01395 [Desulfosalsimonadaceae bacterium]
MESTQQPLPIFAGQWPYHPGKGIAMDITRDLLFLGDGDRIDILDADFNRISTITVTQTGLVSGLFYSASDHLLYAACKNNGLWIVDVSNPEHPFKAGVYLPDASTTEVNGVFVKGELAYLAGGVDGLFILNISDTANPVVLSQSRLPGGWGISYAIDIITSGSFSYVADLYNGIHVVDVTDPAKPVYKKGIALPGASDITLSGNYLYATLQGNGTAIIDVTTPASPNVDSVYTTGGVETVVRVADNLAYIGYGPAGLQAVDVTDPTEPFHNPAWTYTDSGCTSIGLTTGASTLYITTDQAGLEKIDITDKADMKSLLSYDTPADALAVDLSGEYAVIIDDNAGTAPESEGLRIIRISPFKEAVQLYLTGFCPTPGEAKDVKISGDFAFVADGEMGLQIIDMTDKTAPAIVGSCDTPGFASGVFVTGSYAYIADGDMGIAVVNVSNKTAPVRIASIDTPGVAENVAVAGNYAFIADGDAGLHVADITDKTTPVIIGAVDTPGAASGVFVAGNYAFVADGEMGLSVIDITDKTQPLGIASMDTPGFAGDISVIGNYAYVADGKEGVCVINVTIPAQPVREDSLAYDSTGFASDISGGYTSEGEALFAFIADGPAGLIALNLIPEKTDYTVDPGGSGGACFIRAAKGGM